MAMYSDLAIIDFQKNWKTPTYNTLELLNKPQDSDSRWQAEITSTSPSLQVMTETCSVF